MKDLKKNLLACFLALVFSSVAYSQFLEISDGKRVTSYKRVATVEIVNSNEESLAPPKTHEKDDSEIKSEKIKVDTARTKAKPKFRFEDERRNDASPSWIKIDDYSYYTAKPGKYWVFISASSGRVDANGAVIIDVEDDSAIVDIGGVKPEPKPDPKPDPPGPGPDDLKNDYGVGQVAYDSAPVDIKAELIVRIYRENAEMLFGRPKLITIEDALKNVRQTQKSMGIDWEEFSKKVDAGIYKAQKDRSYLSGQDWYLLFLEVALAVEKKNE